MNPISKKVYVVLGMPRSGTSTVARAMQALGVYLGDQLIPGRSTWNAKGYFEDKEIVHEVNKKILNLLFDQWESINLLSADQFETPLLTPIYEHAIQLIKQRYNDHLQWGFKDPRTARVLPFWQSVFRELNLEDRYVIVLRNPLASAHSFMKLTKIDLEKGLLLWLAHLIPAIDETFSKHRQVVSYDLLMQDPPRQLQRMRDFFQLNPKEEDINTFTQTFLDKNLKHYDYNDDDFKNHTLTKIVPVAISTYELLLRLAKDEIDFSSASFQNEWINIKKEFQQYYPIYTYIDKIMKKNKEQERKLRGIARSLPWKLIFPIRFIDDKFRKLRHHLRD